MDDGIAQQPQPGPVSDETLRVLTPERWQQVKEIFGRAFECEPELREDLLRQACGNDEALRTEVQSLLSAAEESNNATSNVFHAVVSPSSSLQGLDEAEDPMLNRRIGAYRLEKRIGYGGMASVYLASRADDEYRKQVAVKVLRPDLDNAELLRRFRNERQTLAALDHSNIVKLLDGGSTPEGLPYLVMDYVDGVAIDEYCDRHKLAVERRLHLFCAVCEAVRYAHQNHVIHRDLKPNNILVTDDGTPKLLDFGIAKVLAPDSSDAQITRTATRHLTPAYASPEQVRGETVGAGTDIYSLGVVFYELLTGHRPYRLKQRTPAEVERAICEQEPESPSTAIDRIETEKRRDGTTITKTAEDISRTREAEPAKLRRSLRGDLDNILLKALQKDSKRRYATVEELEHDIRRHLSHEPVQARPSTLTYRTSKFVRRRKSEVTATVLVILVLAAAVGLLAWQQRRATTTLGGQRSGGRRSVAVLGFKNLSARPDSVWLSTALAEMLTSELSAGDKLRTVTGEQVAQTRTDLSLPDTDSLAPETLARVRRNLATDYVVLGSYLDLGENAFRLDVRLQDTVNGETIATVAENGSETALFDLVSRVGTDLRQKLGLSADSTGATLKASMPSNPEAARLYVEGLTRLRVFDALGARELLEKAIAIDSNYALAHSALSECWATLGYDVKARDEAKKAFNLATNLLREQNLWIEAHYYQTANSADKAMEIYESLFKAFPDNLDYGLQLARSQIDSGKANDGLATLLTLRKFPAPAGDDPRIDLAEASAASSLSDNKREAAAATRAEQKGRSQGARLIVARAVLLEGHAYERLGDHQKSRAAIDESRQLYAAAGNRSGEADALYQLGKLSLPDLNAAEKIFRETLQIRHELGSKGGESQSLNAIAIVQSWGKDFRGAADSYRQALVLADEVGDVQGGSLILHNLGDTEKDIGDFTSAKVHLQEALTLGLKFGDKGLIAGCYLNLADVYSSEGNLASAKKMAHKALQVFKEMDRKPDIAGESMKLADLEVISGELNVAEKLYDQALKIFGEMGEEGGASYATSGIGDILLARGDLRGARQKYEAAFAVRQKLHANGRYMFDNRTRLAVLSLEEGQASGAETTIRQAIKDYDTSSEADARIEGDAVLIRSLLAQKKLGEAKQTSDADQKLMLTSENRLSRMTADISRARVEIAMGSPSAGIKVLENCAREARNRGYTPLEFEARLSLGEAQIQADNAAAGNAELSELQHDARAREFMLIARRAAKAAKQSQH